MQLPITLYPSKRSTILWLLVCILFVFAGYWLIQSGSLVGWATAILFGIGAVVFTVTLLPNSSYLRISKQGLEIRTLYKSGFINWSDVERFDAGSIGSNKMVLVSYTAEHTKYQTAKSVARFLAGTEGALPDTYGHTAEQLAEKLNFLKSQCSKK